eukprot:scaffold93655_cov24-Tisochrysis_lutea.AAC.1
MLSPPLPLGCNAAKRRTITHVALGLGVLPPSTRRHTHSVPWTDSTYPAGHALPSQGPEVGTTGAVVASSRTPTPTFGEPPTASATIPVPSANVDDDAAAA